MCQKEHVEFYTMIIMIKINKSLVLKQNNLIPYYNTRFTTSLLRCLAGSSHADTVCWLLGGIYIRVTGNSTHTLKCSNIMLRHCLNQSLNQMEERTKKSTFAFLELLVRAKKWDVK